MPQRLPRSRRRGALSHAEALATGNVFTRINSASQATRLYRRIERSAVLQGLDQATVPALLRMLLNEGKPAHQNQSCYDKSGYDVLRHGCHSMGLATRAKDDELHGRGRQCAARLAIDQSAMADEEYPLFLDRELASHAGSARAGRSRQSQAKWAGPRVCAPRTAPVTAPFLIGVRDGRRRLSRQHPSDGCATNAVGLRSESCLRKSASRGCFT